MGGGHLFFNKNLPCIKNDYYLCTRKEDCLQSDWVGQRSDYVRHKSDEVFFYTIII